jgi:hypothetical protein
MSHDQGASQCIPTEKRRNMSRTVGAKMQSPDCMEGLKKRESSSNDPQHIVRPIWGRANS